MAEGKVCVIAIEDPYHLGVLSSRIHVKWSLATGGFLGVGNDPVYVKTRCFETFPFPAASETQKETIRRLAEALDEHRKARQAQHPKLTMTDMYNVLEKLKAGEALNEKEKKIHEQGLVGILHQLHQELDAAVAAAYGWPAALSDEAILERLVTLNRERAAEEARGLIRWLRPAYQHPQGMQQGDLGLKTQEKTAAVANKREPQPWPKTLPEQVQAVQKALAQHERPATAEALLKDFKGIGKTNRTQRLEQVETLLETLYSLGLIRKTEEGRFGG